MTSEEEFSRDRAAIRCARSTMLLYSLASSRDLSTTGEKQEEGEMRRELQNLRRKLFMEKKMMNRIKLFGLMELILLNILVLLLSTFFFIFFFVESRQFSIPLNHQLLLVSIIVISDFVSYFLII